MCRIVITGPSPVQIFDVPGPLEVFSSGPGYEIALGSPHEDRVLGVTPGEYSSPFSRKAT